MMANKSQRSTSSNDAEHHSKRRITHESSDKGGADGTRESRAVLAMSPDGETIVTRAGEEKVLECVSEEGKGE
jgi:hypothetical protein